MAQKLVGWMVGGKVVELDEILAVETVENLDTSLAVELVVEKAVG